MARRKEEPTGDTLFGASEDFYLDPYGQLTINNIDSLIGLQCQDIIKAELELKKAQDTLDVQLAEVMKVMQERGLNKITVLGKTIIYKEPKLSEPKIVIKGSNEG